MLHRSRPLRDQAAGALAAALLAAAFAGCSGTAYDAGKPPSTDPPSPSSPSASVDGAVLRQGLADLYAGSSGPDAADGTDGSDERAGRCFADELTDRVTAAELQGAGVVDASGSVVADLPALPAPLAEHWVDAQLSCADFYAESARAQVAASKGAVDAEAYAACLRGRVTEQQVRAALEEALTASLDGPAVGRLGRAQAECAAGA